MKFGTVELGKIPRVILAVDNKNLKDKLFRARNLKIDLIEARIDLINYEDEREIKKLLDTIGDFGFFAVATVRPNWEGGNFSLSEEKRLEIFKFITSHPAVAAVDIELNAKEILKRTISIVKSHGKKVITSYHDFEKTPENEEILSIIEKAKSNEADIVKCAFKANSPADTGRVQSLMHSISFPKIFMLMGEHGKISRVDSFNFGSLLSYTFIGKAVAPGQIEAEELVKLITYFYPEYKKEKGKLLFPPKEVLL